MSRSFDVPYGPDDEDVYAAARSYFDQLPDQDQEAWDSLDRVSLDGAKFKSVAHQLALRLGAEPEEVSLVEAEAGPEGPRYTAVARLDGEDLLFRGQVHESQTVVLDVSLDFEELGQARVVWDERGEHGWLEVLPDGRHEPGVETLRAAYQVVSGVEPEVDLDEAADVPELSPLEVPLSEAERFELPSVDELESWPVIGEERETLHGPRDFDWGE